MSNCIVTPVVGYPQLYEWASVAQNQSHSLTLVFALKGEGANNLGKDLVDQIKAYEPQGAEDLHQGLLDLLSQVRHTNCNIQFAVALVSTEKVVFASFAGNISIKKPGKIVTVIGGTDQLQLVEGKRGAYTAILATESSGMFLAEAQQRLLQNYDPAAVASGLVTAIQDQSDTSLVSLAFIELHAPIMASAEGLLAHASTVMVRGETTTPTISVENLEETPATPSLHNLTHASPSISRIAGTLPHRPSSVQRFLRDTATTSHRLGSIVAKQITLQTPKVARLLQRSVVIIGHWLSQVPKLPARYHVADNATKIKIWIVVGGTIAFLVAAGVFGIVKHREYTQLEQRYQTAIAGPQTLRAEASNLLATDPVQARNKATQSVTDLEALATQFQHNRTITTQLQTEIAQAKAFASDISGRLELSQLQVFFDLRLTDTTFVANSVSLVGSKLYFLDKEKHQLVILDTATKQSSLTALPITSQPVDWAATSKKLYLLDKGISDFDFESKQLSTLKETGDTDKDATLLRSFDPYLYVLNPTKRNIFRFTLDKSGLSPGIGWVTNKKDLDFSAIQDFVIDGSLWLTTKTGDIKKYSQGQPQTFQVSGLETAFNSPLSLYTSENLTSLFILEPNQHRLVILSKEGKLIKEIKSPELGAATSLVVSDTNVIYVLSGSTVYMIPGNS